MVSFAGLRDARLGDLAEAAESWKRLSVQLDRAHRHVIDQQAKVRRNWKGTDAEAAHAQMQMLREKSYAAQQTVAGIGRVVAAAHQRFKAAQAGLLDAIEQARSARFQVGDDGSLRWPPSHGPTTVPEQVKLQQAAKQFQDRMAAALRTANDADKKVAEALGMLKPEVLDVSHADDDPKQIAWRATWLANPNDVDGRTPLSDIIKKYQVTPDPEGMTKYPDGFVKWLAERLGRDVDPKEVTMSEKRLLDGLFAQDPQQLLRMEKNQTLATDGPPKWMPEGRYDGHGDAWRHAYWNALMTRDFGPTWTEKFGIAHERIDRPNAGAREAMDLYNNEVGRRIAQQHPDASDEEMARYVQQAVNRGEMVVIGQDGQLNWSDRAPKGETMNQRTVDRQLPEYGPGQEPSNVGR
ncbi:hypothetical protein [Spirillospora sp. NPDC029432]|uniref:WXG100 family type VII secretion target n=1 Tax=Spirillospora sp. NPDC029432 TaxID=3154599 RepID=UPI0034563E31